MSSLVLTFLTIINILTPNFTAETVPKEPGTYSVVVSYSGEEGQISKTINTTIGTQNYIQFEDVAMDVNDIYASQDQELSAEFLINNSKVKSWNINSGEEYLITGVDINQQDEEVFLVTYTSEVDTSISAYVYFVEQEQIYAKYINDDSKYSLHYINKNYTGFWFMIVFFILVFFAIFTYVLTQIRAYKELHKIKTQSYK